MPPIEFTAVDAIMGIYAIISIICVVLVPALLVSHTRNIETAERREANLQLELHYLRNELNEANRIIDEYIDEKN